MHKKLIDSFGTVATSSPTNVNAKESSSDEDKRTKIKT